MATPQRRAPTALHLPATLLLVSVSFLGAFSRFTSGRYTPQWYAFQVARAPNASLVIPAMDAILGSLLIPRRTRPAAAAIITAFFGMGVGMRVNAGASSGTNALLLGLALTVLGTSW